MTLLGQMQSLLAALYDAPVAHDVHDYLITDPAHAAALQELPSPPATDEQLLIATTDDGMELGLYLDVSVLERLGRRCPLVALDESNLGDYCTALEGVSHFHYLTWSADCDRRVSLLELELQAEVDKYASALSLLLAQRGGRFPGELAVLDQVQQVGLDLRRAQQVGTAVVVACHSGDGIGVALLGPFSQAAHGHGVEHALT